MTADPLSDLLSLLRTTGAHVARVDLPTPWRAQEHATAQRLAQWLPPHTQQVIAFHVVLEGECWIRQAQGDWLAIPPDHAVVVAQDAPYELRDQPGCRTCVAISTLQAYPPQEPRPASGAIDSGPVTRLLCGFLGYDLPAFAPLHACLPSVLRVALSAPTQLLVRYASEHSADTGPGAAGLCERVAELLLLGLLRAGLDRLPIDATGWLVALRDPALGQALGVLHADPSRHWTVAALARTCASSRSALAVRFAHVLGESPMHYLARLRMHLAARELGANRNSLATVAADVGYESPAAFQRAFKRAFGMPAAAWRRRELDRWNVTPDSPRRRERRHGERRQAGRDRRHGAGTPN